MCKDLKIHSQASKSKAKYEVGNFCTQYGLPSVIPKRKSKFREKSSSEKPHRRRTVAKYYRKQKFKTDDSIRKESPNPQVNPYPKHQENASTVVKEVILGRSVNRRLNTLSTL